MSTSAFVGNSDGLVTGLCPAPPPPPPPPPAPGQVPAMRINTVEAPAIRRPQIANNDAYEPPAAIQNAMLTKDKKPFTYTPGMGGKLDLSQIRSPRMARRVAKNANDEGIEGPPKSALEPKPTPAPNAGVNLFVQPQVAIPVFPTNIPPSPSARTPPTPPANRIPSIVPAPEKQSEPAKPVTKAEAKVTPVMVTIPVQPSSPESPGTPTQVTLAKAPTPWLQNKNKPQEELPEWAKRSNVGKQSSSPDSPTSPPVYTSVQQMQQQPPSPQQWQQTQQKQQSIQQRPLSQQSQQYQYQQQQQQQPPQFNQQQQQKRPFSSPPGTQQAGPQTQPQERVIPIRIEDRPSVFDVKPEPGHHQFKQPSPHHKQRWGQPPVQCQGQNQVQQQPVTPPQPVQSPGGGYVIPIMIEGSDKKVGGPASNVSYSQPTVRNNAPSIENQTVKVVQQRGPPPAMQSDTGPVQSRSFRVLQKITDTDAPNDVDSELIRKLQLSDDDRVLMNKFKEQVDTDSSLHQEEDPRYRGAAIPSRAFRFLQTMTDSGEVLVPPTTPRPPSAVNKRQNRNSKTFEESQANLPPSEQQVPEPKKYMGSAIPSRSFRILQAMTAPESVATQENRQADYTCQTENNMPGNQQGVFLPPCPPPFWSPEGGWWGYYPLPYPGVTNDSYPCQPENTAYIYFPIYNQNYTGYPQYDATNSRTDTYAGVYPPCVVSVPPQSDNNYSHACGQGIDNVALPKIDPAASIPDDKSNEDKPSKDPETLNALPRWGRANSMSRTASTNSKDSDCTTAMNITDEEEIPETMMAPPINGDVKKPNRLETNTCPNGNSLNVAVPNYTYIDTSDSSDSTDSESQTDNESVAESCKSSSDNNVDDTSSSDSDDSDSYLAYSTGLNPHRFDKDAERNATRTRSSKESCDDRHDPTSSSSERNNTDCDSDAEEQIDRDSGKTDNTAFPHQLSVIYEDVEHGESESPRLQKETPIEATDDPPDDTDTTTVSVSLPLRFKFSVSENNEDVTTVIVGDSTIKPERIKDDGKCSRYQEHRTHEKTNDVSANFLVNNDTTVDFTVKRDTSDGKRRTKNHANERQKEETAETKTEKNEDLVVPHVNFTLRKIPTRLGRINCEETVETEFTIKSRKTSARKEGAGGTHGGSDKEQEGRTVNANTSACNGENATVSKQSESVESSNVAKIAENSLETRDCGKNIPKPEVVVSECKRTAESSRDSSKNFQSANLQVEQHEMKKAGNEEEEKTNKEPKHLLSVQNSREETDDEDSGVTSDMSRMISEVDTDSECTSSKNIRKYQRTQTHSRLFKLLNDDSVLQEDAEKVNDSTTSREYLSLPLRSNGFNYDESYCSNYSSGLTSPDYSPVCEQSWRRLHEAENASQRVPDQNGDVFRHAHPLTRQERAVCKEDAYYQAWKTSKSPTCSDHDVVPSLAFKVLECRRPPWAYKVNVLCPRIKSTKSVPQALRTRKTTDSPIPSNPTSYVNLRTDHC